MHLMLKNKNVVITGGSQGLGYEIASKYVQSGANVLIFSRNKIHIDSAIQKLSSIRMSGQILSSSVGDVACLADVELCRDIAMRELGGCDILINNAGIYGPKGLSEDVDWTEWKRAIEVNLYGSVLMCRAFLPVFKRQQKGKIIQLSGGGATNPNPYLTAYAASKAAVVRFIESLADEVRGQNIYINAIAPGALNTKMLDEVLTAGPDLVGKVFYEKSLKQKQDGGSSMEFAADLALFLGSDLSDGITAKLISAVWDNWREWANHLDEINKSDVYTLRRIVGRDRGKDWGDVQ
jgi:NAD(P)-dependent dehydrogenase (short-subunit alcohol dehydrogenase family)